MKTLHRLYVSTRPLTAQEKADRELASQYLGIPGVVKVQNSYRVAADVLSHLELESDDDLDEASLRRYVAEPGFHNVHLILSEQQWEGLGLRPTLYGQSRVVGGQVITYGAWDDRRGILDKYPSDIRDFFTENTLGEWHELDHGLRTIFNISTPTTHAIFYGYAAADSDKDKSRRWVRKPYPLEAWRALPWHLLDDRQPRRPLMLQIIEGLQTVVTTLTKRAEVQTPPKDLVPAVKVKAQRVTEIMDMIGYPVRIVEGYRTLERQAQLYAQGRTKPGSIVTNARAGESYHNYGVAVDYVFRREGYDAPGWLWDILGRVGKAQGFSWGGDWKDFVDRPHFELTLDYRLSDFQKGNVDYNRY